MPLIHATVDCPIHDSPRVRQVAGMFDLAPSNRASVSLAVDVPGVEEDWRIGLIVGPSGSGKTTIARREFPGRMANLSDWPSDRAVVDCFGPLSTEQITSLLTAVGFSSPPAWLKPYVVLSTGERFRCDLARALAAGMTARTPPLVVVDEFTSVVDRNVARIGSAAVAKAIRRGQIGARLVAVTCHNDLRLWLAPDWVVDMDKLTCRWGRLRRPAIQLRLCRAERDLWRVFAPHHYLSGELSRGARCYAAWWQGTPVAFCAMLTMIGRRRHWRISRIVTLPDFQGVGIGMRVAEGVCELYRRAGCRTSVTARHPALTAHCRGSPLWRTTRILRSGSGIAGARMHAYRSTAGRSMVSFEYVGRG